MNDYILCQNNNLSLISGLRYYYLTNSLGTESHGKPWLELKAQFDKIDRGYIHVGGLASGCTYTYIGAKMTDAYASFLVFSYTGAVYYVWCNAGVWKYNSIDIGTGATF